MKKEHKQAFLGPQYINCLVTQSCDLRIWINLSGAPP
jgi:hypothetical protein